MMRAICLIASCAVLAGCGTRIVRVSVPVPVACQEQIAERPVMPTDALAPGAEPFVVLRASLAEIDRREGYETLLRTALVACTAPLK